VNHHLARLAGLSVTVGGFLPRLRLPSVVGPMLTPSDMVEEGAVAVCIYNPAAVNPFPLPPPGVNLAQRLQMLADRDVRLYVISGLGVRRLASWMEYTDEVVYALSDADGDFAAQVGIPIKRVDGRNFRTHVAFVLQEDRILSILLETDPIHQFERLLQALDVADGREPGEYKLPDQPRYGDGRNPTAFEDEEDDEE